MIGWSDDRMIGWSDDNMIWWSDNHDDQMIMTIMNDQSIRGSANSTSLNVDIYTGFLQYKKSINVFEGRRRRGGRGWGERGKPGGESQTSFICFFVIHTWAHLRHPLDYNLGTRHLAPSRALFGAGFCRSRFWYGEILRGSFFNLRSSFSMPKNCKILRCSFF